MNPSQCLTLVLFAFVACGCVDGNADCLPEHRSLLLDLKHGLTLLPGELASWEPGSDCCGWEGITCDPRSGRVIGLDLSGRRIAGGSGDSHALFGLTSLHTLNLSDARFGGLSIPQPGFEKLIELRHLDLSGAGFVGQIPIGISRLARLEYLDLSACSPKVHLPGIPEMRNPNFSTMIRNLNNLRVLMLPGVDLHQDPEWATALVTSLPQLQVLDLQQTNLTGTIPESFGNLKNLTVFGISSNNLTGAIPASIGKLVKLTLLDLSFNGLTGPIPKFLFSLPLLEDLVLSGNQLSGELDSSLNASTSLRIIALNDNQLCGQIPPPFFYLPSLGFLKLGSNNFSGAIELDMIATLNNLALLDLSNNRLSLGEFDGSNFLSLPNLTYLSLASCGLTKVPTFLNNSKNMDILDLSSNMLHGPILNPPSFASYVDFSDNSFSSPIAPEFFFNLSRMKYFLASNNDLSGEIPPSICNATTLEVLDISNNLFSGSIPSCLLESGHLVGMNLGRNMLEGIIPQNITNRCLMTSLILNDNRLEGSLPRSLVNCGDLQVLDLGNNHIVDTFPFWLGDHVSLQVLSLRSNRFYGPLGLTERQEANYTFPQLQVFDLSSNNFSGKLSPKSFSGLRRIMNMSNSARSFLNTRDVPSSFYKISIAVIKGQEIQLLNILYTVIDFSNNSFEGNIPSVIGGLQGLHVLNLSHNSLTGNIPFEIGNLTELQSLDLSTNHLSGEIPQYLTSLTFLEWLNLSNNNLAGRIPQAHQFSTFSNASFQQNTELCGIPLSKQCGNTIPNMTNAMSPAVISDHSSSLSSYVIGLALSIGIGYGVGLALVIVLLNTRLKFLIDYIDAIS